MKRNTVKELDLYPFPRSMKRNKSWQHSRALLDGSLKYKTKFAHEFICSKTIVNMCLQEIVSKTEQKFQQVDERNRIKLFIKTSEMLKHYLELLQSPLDREAQINTAGYTGESEPRRSMGDILCGGGIPVQESKSVNNRRTSIVSSIGEHKKEKSGFVFGSKANDSKCTVKLPKEQVADSKKSLEALTSFNGEGDRVEELLRDRMMRESQHNRPPPNLRQSKEGFFDKITPSVEQFSYDYDGTVFPLKKGSKCILEKIKILNTTYRISNRDVVEDSRQNVPPKLHNFQLKTEGGQPQRQRQNRNIHRGSRKLTSDSTRHLMRVCNQLPSQINWKVKVQDMLKGKAVRIRELKQIN